MARPISRIPDSSKKVLKLLDALEKGSHSIYLSKSVFRVFHCRNCQICCMRFTLDYVPNELLCVPEDLQQFFIPCQIEFRGKKFLIYRFDQSKLDSCPFLRSGQGCTLYPNGPISCMMAPQIQVWFQEQPREIYIFKRGFSHHPAAPHFNELCEFTCSSSLKELREELDRDLVLWRRLERWAKYFEIETVIPRVIQILEGPPIFRTVLVWEGKHESSDLF